MAPPPNSEALTLKRDKWEPIKAQVIELQNLPLPETSEVRQPAALGGSLDNNQEGKPPWYCVNPYEVEYLPNPYIFGRNRATTTSSHTNVAPFTSIGSADSDLQNPSSAANTLTDDHFFGFPNHTSPIQIGSPPLHQINRKQTPLPTSSVRNSPVTDTRGTPISLPNSDARNNTKILLELSANDGSPYYCDDCKEQFDEKCILNQHYSTEHKRKHKCPVPTFCPVSRSPGQYLAAYTTAFATSQTLFKSTPAIATSQTLFKSAPAIATLQTLFKSAPAIATSQTPFKSAPAIQIPSSSLQPPIQTLAPFMAGLIFGPDLISKPVGGLRHRDVPGHALGVIMAQSSPRSPAVMDMY
ncbi:hypothetical protein DL98DRAFT_577437 [Cadophora sp. DSE1049]|nr:hypothetical protein DL98DRAFT_577437 [Cadophora sp. DSE1049]